MKRAILAAFIAAQAIVLAPAYADSSETLRARYEALRDKLANSAFMRPLYLESRQTPGKVEGDIYAVIDHAFGSVRQAVRGPAQWCDILILHLNVKDCKADSRSDEAKLVAHIGSKRDMTSNGAHRVSFGFEIVDDSAEYLRIGLSADRGPMGTRDYRIVLQATTVDDGRTFVHFYYSYGYGPAAALAMRTYMNTVGAQKVGFTVVDRRTDGTPVLVGDVRGALERNAMRYFLAVDACVSTASLPSQNRFEERLERWFDSTERYSHQLHELDRGEYLSMKRASTRQ
jgi:hypothetical protein